MQSSKIESTLINRDAVLSTIWSTIQQLVVAASTMFILKAIQFATAGDVRTGLAYIAAFVASLVIVYLPNAISMLYLQRWRLSSIDSFVKTFAERNFGKTSFGHSRNKVNAEAWLTNECFTVYDEITDLLYQMYSTLMNAVLNILVIAVALDRRILAWYVVAGGVLLASNKFFRRRIQNVAVDVQSSRKDLAGVMLSVWDNIFVGNHHNFDRWNQRYSLCMQGARASATRYDVVRSLISSGTVSVALLIVAIGNGIFLYENIASIPMVAALFITLPRQLQIIQSIFAFFNLVLSWTGVHRQLKEMQTVLELGAQNIDPRKFIQHEAIEIVGPGGQVYRSEFDHAIESIRQVAHGRFTLRGRNGAGKSTLLSLMKETLASKAFYLPTHYADLNFETDFLNHSDGNRLLHVFREISQLDGVEVVILDEWDANLDQENVRAISEAIEQLSKTKVVVESRHRQN